MSPMVVRYFGNRDIFRNWIFPLVVSYLFLGHVIALHHYLLIPKNILHVSFFPLPTTGLSTCQCVLTHAKAKEDNDRRRSFACSYGICTVPLYVLAEEMHGRTCTYMYYMRGVVNDL